MDILMAASLENPDFFWPGALPPRPADGHKGTFGRALFVVGSQGYYGAPLYAPLAFLRCGGGYANVFCTSRVAQILAANGQGAGFVYYEGEECPETGGLSNSQNNLEKAHRAARNVDIVVVGPGLGEGSETLGFLGSFLFGLKFFNPNVPVLLDADALRANCMFTCTPNPFILTPHLGELKRLEKDFRSDLSSCSKLECTEPNFDNPVNTAVSLLYNFDLWKNTEGDPTILYGEVVILIKGQHSQVLSRPSDRPSDRPSLSQLSITRNPSGNSGLAKAGSGDVLCGCIAGIYCLLRLGPRKESNDLVAYATRCAVFIHGVAGDLTAKDLGEDSMTPFDVLNMGLPQAMKTWRAYSTGNTRDLWAQDYPKISDS